MVILRNSLQPILSLVLLGNLNSFCIDGFVYDDCWWEGYWRATCPYSLITFSFPWFCCQNHWMVKFHSNFISYPCFKDSFILQIGIDGICFLFLCSSLLGMFIILLLDLGLAYSLLHGNTWGILFSEMVFFTLLLERFATKFLSRKYCKHFETITLQLCC